MDANIIGLIVIGVLLAIMWILVLTKSLKSKAKTIVTIFGVLGIVYMLLAIAGHLGVEQLQNTFFLSAVAPPTPQVTTAGTITTTIPGVTKDCSYDGNTLTFSSIDKYAGTASGGVHAYVRKGSSLVNYVADAGTASLTPYETITVLLGNGSDNSYFAEKFDFEVPCAAASEIKLPDGSTPTTVRNGTFTFNIYNEENEQIGSSANETIGSGESSTMKYELRALDQRGFPHGGLFIVQLDGANFTEADTKMTFEGASLRKVSQPDAYTISSTADKAITFEVGPILGTTLRSGDLYVKAETGITPDTNCDIEVEFHPYDWFINEDTGNSFDGPAVEDEDGVYTFGHTTTTTLHID